MTPIEIIALIVAIVAAIKIIVVLIKPKAWLNSVVKPVYSKPTLTMLVSLILAVLVLYYLLMELNIIQIFAVMAFLALIMALSFAAYFREIVGLAEKMLRDNHVIKRAWLAILIWIILICWTLYVLFA